MTVPRRDEIEHVLRSVDMTGLTTPEERNGARTAAVAQFLDEQKVTGVGTQGNVVDMILGDLASYREWEDG